MSEKKQMSLEERFAELEAIVNRMEEADVTLDESFELYKKGVSEVKEAGKMLDQIEKAMLVLNEDGELEEF